jgi:hypothetical protein
MKHWITVGRDTTCPLTWRKFLKTIKLELWIWPWQPVTISNASRGVCGCVCAHVYAGVGRLCAKVGVGNSAPRCSPEGHALPQLSPIFIFPFLPFSTWYHFILYFLLPTTYSNHFFIKKKDCKEICDQVTWSVIVQTSMTLTAESYNSPGTCI